MIDHLLGRPSTSSRRWQILAVLLFWSWRFVKDDPRGPFILRPLIKRLKHLSPWQIIVVTCSTLYAIQNVDTVLGLSAPEPLAHLYSPNYYRATYLNTALETGFATTMSIKPKWLRDIASILATGYYLIFARAADEKIRKFRDLGNVEFLRTTWDKTANPYLQLIARFTRPRLNIRREIALKRPKGSPYTRPISAWLYYNNSEQELKECTELVLDFPGGGFVCMGPTHHEDRLLILAAQLNRPILSVDYGKAPEYPFPFAVHEALDVYRCLHETKGKNIGLSGKHLDIIVTGDSAGANISTSMILYILEEPDSIRAPLPVSVIYAYPALDFNVSSWMNPEHLRTIFDEYSNTDPGILMQKDHMSKRDPLEVTDFRYPRKKASWTKSLSKVFAQDSSGHTKHAYTFLGKGFSTNQDEDDDRDDESLSNRVVFQDKTLETPARSPAWPVISDASNDLETKLTMTSRSCFFNDRIITLSMMRTMAILYIGPRNSPDFATNYHISPILAPDELLAEFPPITIICGEKDPFIDDTIIFAGRIREAKRAKRLEIIRKSMRVDDEDRPFELSGEEKVFLEEESNYWAQTRIIKGWSHGFLLMLPILPEANQYVNIMGEWILNAFHKKFLKRTSNEQPRSPKHNSDEGGESDDQESVLSFTTRRRGDSTSRTCGSGSIRRESFHSTNIKQRRTSDDDSNRDSFSARYQSKNEGTGGSPSSSSPPPYTPTDDINHPNFLDADALLRRRREGAVIGLSSRPLSRDLKK